jgi:hypothetical protein
LLQTERLDEFVRERVGDPSRQPHWLSIYLGEGNRVPRVYSTRPEAVRSTWWTENNGIVLDQSLLTEKEAVTHQGVIDQSGDLDFMADYTSVFGEPDEGLRLAVMFETNEPDAFRGAWGAFEVEACRRFALSVAEFLGFVEGGAAKGIILPDRFFELPEFGKVLVPVITTCTDAVLEHLRKSPLDIHRLSPRAFEELIAGLLSHMGYRVTLTPSQKDQGRDVLAVLPTQLGELLTIVECKKWRRDRPIPVDIVRGVYGVLSHERATHAVIATTSRFTKDAQEFRDTVKYQMSLRDGDAIIQWILDMK